jgi:hypothetical protein
VGPTRYRDYEALADRVLKPGGQLLAVLMEVTGREPPPFSIPPDTALGLFAPPRWTLTSIEPVVPTNPRRPGRNTLRCSSRPDKMASPVRVQGMGAIVVKDGAS